MDTDSVDIGERLRRLLELNGNMASREAARRTGVNHSTISKLVSSDRPVYSGQKRILESLARGFNVPLSYFTEPPQRFMSMYLATLPDYQKKALADTPFVERVKWILGEMERYFGAEYSLPAIAERLEYDLEDLEAPLRGEWEMAPGMVQTLAEFTGAGDWLIRPQFMMPDHIRRGYDAVTIRAWTHGVGPEPLGVVVDTIIDAAKQIHTDKEKQGGHE